MAKPARFTPRKTASGWCINIPSKYSESGKRERHFYATRDKANDAAAKLREARDSFGSQASAIPPSLAEQATAAVGLLAPLGIGLLDAVQRFVEAETRNRASVAIEDAIAAFRARGDDTWSDKQSTAYRLRGEKLVETFGKRMISTITGEELQKHLDDTTGGPGSFNQSLRLVRAIWRWCAKPPRKWCDTEAVQHLEAKEAHSEEIGLLTGADAAKLMQAAEKHFPDTVPAFAIALFTGMRQKEIERLVPDDVTPDGITVPAINAKTKRRRFIQMPDPLAAWLEAYPINDAVIPPDWYRKQRAVRRLAGFRIWSDLVEPNEPPDDLPLWPANALRHTAATVAVATGKPLEALVFEHGHSGGLEMLRRHYVGAMPKAEAVKISSIGPHGTKLKTIKAA